MSNYGNQYRKSGGGSYPPRDYYYRQPQTRGKQSAAHQKKRRGAEPVGLLSRAVCIIFALTVLAGIGALAAGRIVRWAYPREYSELVEYNCRLYGVDETLAYAVIRTESGFDPRARSDVGAMGLMQITPETFDWLQTKLPDESGRLGSERLYDPEINIRYGVYFLSRLKEEFSSDTLTAAAYHAGRGRVSGWLDDGTLDYASGYSEIPSGTTGHYVHKVENARDVYIKLYY